MWIYRLWVAALRLPDRVGAARLPDRIGAVRFPDRVGAVSLQGLTRLGLRYVGAVRFTAWVRIRVCIGKRG